MAAVDVDFTVKSQRKWSLPMDSIWSLELEQNGKNTHNAPLDPSLQHVYFNSKIYSPASDWLLAAAAIQN